MAETTSGDSVELDPEAKELLLRQRKAEARKAIAEADKAAAAAMIPDITIPEEQLDVGEKGSKLAELVAYRHLDAVADRIATSIRNDWPVSGKNVLIVTDLNMTASCATHSAVLAQARALRDRLNNSLESLVAAPAEAEVDLDRLDAGVRMRMLAFDPVTIAGVGIASTLITTGLQALRTNWTVRPVEFALEDVAVAATVAQSLRQLEAKVRLAAMTVIPSNAVSELLNEVAVLRDSVADRLLQFRIAGLEGGLGAQLARDLARMDILRKELDARLDKAEEREDLKKAILELQALISEREPKVAQERAHAATAEDVIADVDKFMAAVYQADATGMSPAAQAVLIHDACSDGGTDLAVLYVKAASAGGESIYKEKWRDHSALHVGGVAVTWVLTDRTGHVLSSGVQTGVGSLGTEFGESLDWHD